MIRNPDEEFHRLREPEGRIPRRMAASGLVVGNVSAPYSNVLVMPTGLDHAKMAPEDVALVDLDDPFAPFSEALTYTPIYRARRSGEPVILMPEQMFEAPAIITDHGQPKIVSDAAR